MTTTQALFILGTPFGAWAGAAAELLSSAPSALEPATPALARWHDELLGPAAGTVPPPVRTLTATQLHALQSLQAGRDRAWWGIDERACWTFERLLECYADARFLVFVDHPVRQLTAWMAAATDSDAPAAAALMRAQNARLLRLVQSRAAQCLVVSADEARATPEAWARRCGNWLGVTLSALRTAEGQPVGDALCAVLAQAMFQADAAWQALSEELHACCARLEPASEEDIVDFSALAADPILALQQLRRGAASARALERASKDASAAAAECRQALERAQQRADALAADVAALEEGRRLLLDQTITQLDAMLAPPGTAVAASVSTADAALIPQHLRRLRLELDRRSALLVEQRARLEELVRRSDVQSAFVEAAAAREQAARQDASQARREAQLRMLQCQQLQEETAELAREACAKVRAPAGRGASWSDQIELGVLQLGPARDTPPHRELGFTLGPSRIGSRELPSLALRLVEHHGHPGLVVFAGHEPPLTPWVEHGSEAAVPFMALIPSEAGSRQVLDRMPTADWQFVNALLDQIDGVLHEDGSSVGRRWPTLARRLRVQLDGLAPRLRYDAIQVADHGVPETIEVAFEHAMFGARHLEHLALRWRFGNAVSLDLLMGPDDADMPPLRHWPVDEEGGWLPNLRLPLDASASAGDKRLQWLAFEADDLALVLALLDALPGVAESVRHGGKLSQGGQSILSKSAPLLLRGVQKSLAGPAWRRLARRLTGRTTRLR